MTHLMPSRSLVGLVVAALLTSCTSPSRPTDSPEISKPNVLLIIADDLRVAGTARSMPRIIDIFSKQGVSFDQAFATTPECCPSRVSMLTGQYVHNHGILSNVGDWAERLDEESTIQRYLSDAGYRSALFGKFLNGWELKRNPKYFDEWAFWLRSSRSYEDGKWNVDGTRKVVPGYWADLVRRRSLGFLRSAEQRDGDPWFMIVSSAAVHSPAVPEDSYRDMPVPQLQMTPPMEEEDLQDKPSFVLSGKSPFPKVFDVRKQQLRALRTLDDLVERLFTQLESLDEAENTLAIFVSDQGFLWGEHGLSGKETPYEASIRIPLMLRWPQRLEAGSVDDRLVANLDIAPTILDAAGIRLNEGRPMDGFSLLTDASRETLLLEHTPNPYYERPGWLGVRSLDAQYIEWEDPGGGRFEEFYDLDRDPWMLESDLEDERLGDYQRILERMSDCAGRDCW